MQQAEREALAAEVLEMGEQLFALALEGRASQQTQMGEDALAQAFPLEELEAASAEFFAALRLLVLQEPATGPDR